jgi:acetyltransferase-like isoleucine patch superfamily enzyme
MNRSKTIVIDPEFIVEDCNFEGYNHLFGSGRAYKSSFGAFTYVQYGANVGYSKIGRFCSIGPNVMIAHGEHPMDFLSTHPLFFESSYIKGMSSFTTEALFNSHKEVNIGSDVWIGANCYIKDGITIGNGAAIGAGSIVTHDIPPYCIAAGVPAKVIRMRFDEPTIQALIKLEWWNWDIDKIIANKKFFQGKLNYESVIQMHK